MLRQGNEKEERDSAELWSRCRLDLRLSLAFLENVKLNRLSLFVIGIIDGKN